MRIAAVFNTAILCSGEFRTQLLLHKYSSPSPIPAYTTTQRTHSLFSQTAHRHVLLTLEITIDRLRVNQHNVMVQ